MVVGIILLISSKADPGGPAFVLFVASMVAAVGYAVLWLARMRFVTRISSEGIEARRYLFTKRIAWSEVRDIQTYHYERADPRRVRGGYISGARQGSNSAKKEMCVKVVRVSGRKVELPAPLVTRNQGDSDFDDKVRTIKAVWHGVRTGTGTGIGTGTGTGFAAQAGQGRDRGRA